MFFTAKKRAEKRMEGMDQERQDLLNQNVRVSEESHNLVSDFMYLLCMEFYMHIVWQDVLWYDCLI